MKGKDQPPSGRRVSLRDARRKEGQDDRREDDRREDNRHDRHGRRNKREKRPNRNTLNPLLWKDVMAVFGATPGQAFNANQLSKLLDWDEPRAFGEITEVLKVAAKKGLLDDLDKGNYTQPVGRAEELPPRKRKRDADGKRGKGGIIGRIEITRHGKGYVVVPGQENDITIGKGHTSTAFWGDTVEVRYESRGRKKYAYVSEIVKRAQDLYVVKLQGVKDYAFGIPGNRHIHRDFLIPARHLNGGKDGLKAAVRLVDWAHSDDPPIAEVVKIFGEPGLNEAEMHAILVEFGLPYGYPEEVAASAEEISGEIDAKEIAKRRDFRDITTLTIDPEDAKDFDDALSLRKLENGHFEVGVHIADVTHYVIPGSDIEAEAKKRATSVYLVDRTIPMLPERLSNDLCSLRPNVDRLAFSAVFEMDEQGEVHDQWFGRTVIHSDRRFTYAEAQERLKSGKGDFAEQVQTLDGISKALRAKRFKGGSIDFNSEEVRFVLDEQARPVEVVIKRMVDANQLIEEFMLLANVYVAQRIGKGKGGKPQGGVYRVHDKPDPEKLSTLRSFVAQFGYKMAKVEPGKAAQALNSLLASVRGKKEERIVAMMAIRSMAKAEYTTTNIGHYGLAFDHYTHFTSPIRRYPDMMVHRLLQHYLDGGDSVDTSTLDGDCAHSSEREKRAASAERASIKYKQVEFLSTHLGEEFSGTVNGISSKSLFVEVDGNRCEGFVDTSTIPGDLWRLERERMCLVGQRTGREIHMGTAVRVRAVRADLERRELEFEWLGT
ncbi:MAG: ribonuclease R [Flavobacteriales bacterium]|nr:ribonuclease R [Flavobacteriales bacterium]